MQAQVKYKSEVKTAVLGDRTITVKNLTPVFSPQEQDKQSREVERRLFDVFRKPQYAGPHLRFSGCAGRRSARLSLLPFCQTASAFRLIYLFHTFFRRGVYRATVFAPLRCPKFF